MRIKNKIVIKIDSTKEKIQKEIKYMNIKIIIFFIIIIYIFILFYLLYCSIWCSIYKNSQKFLIINSNSFLFLFD